MLRDLRHAVRVLLHAKGWTAVVLVSLALGIGANTALFSAINGRLLRTIAARDPDSLVRFAWYGDNDMARSRSEYGYGGKTAAGVETSSTFSYALYQAFRASNETLSDLFAAAPYGQVNAIVDGQAEIASAFLASGTYFDVLGLGAAAGRTITAEDDTRGAAPVAMISHGYWSRRFGRSPDVVGRVVTVNNVPCTIVGVTPAEYTGVQGDGNAADDFHLPLALHPSIAAGQDDLDQPTTWWLQVMGRLKPGVTAEQVTGNLAGVFQASARAGLDAYLGGLSDDERSLSRNREGSSVPTLHIDSGRRGIYETNPDTRKEAQLLGGVVVLVLLVVCANVANLLLSRATTRRQEIGVRLSLGATRGRLVRQLVTESVVLAAIGGLLALVVAFWARRLLPFGQAAPLDWKVLAFVAALSVLTGVAFSVVPALRATRVDLSASLKEQSRSVKGSRSLLGRGLLVLQVAVSLVLLVAAGLFLDTLRNLRSVDVGFDPSNILLFRLDPTLNGYEPTRIAGLYDEVQERLSGLGGVQSVSLSQMALLGGSSWISTVHFEGRTDRDGAHMMHVSPEFFATLTIPLLAGRVFDERDGDEGPRVALLNATAARAFLDGEEALGRRFGFSPETRSEVEVVGIVRDVKYSDLRVDAPPTVFLPMRRSDLGPAMFEVKTAGDPRALVSAVRGIVSDVDPHVPLIDVSTQREQIDQRVRRERYFAMSYSMFGGLALLLAAIGLFGLASYNVARRTNEIGIRMALGARRADVVRMILRESLVLVAVGIGLGAAAAFAAGRFLATLLYGVAPADLPTLAIAAALLVAVSTVAGYLPARRASRVDPLVALQNE